jgi:hypothetical protein
VPSMMRRFRIKSGGLCYGATQTKVMEKLNGILKTGAQHSKKVRSQGKASDNDEEAQDALMRQSQMYQITRDCRILLKLGELDRHPEIRKAHRHESLRVDETGSLDGVPRLNEDYVRAVKQERLDVSEDVTALIGRERKRRASPTKMERFTKLRRESGGVSAAAIKREADRASEVVKEEERETQREAQREAAKVKTKESDAGKSEKSKKKKKK